MSADVETMMYVREKPWHNLGVQVMDAPGSEEAIRYSGLDWKVNQEPVFNADGEIIIGFKANVRDDGSILGIVGDRYKVVQNTDAFRFTDGLIGGEVHYETAGSLKGGKQIWLLAKLPGRLLAGDETETYLCFTNSHDGSTGIRAVLTPVRVVCNNTLSLALSKAKRSWSLRHTENIQERLEEAKDCLFHANRYMSALADYADFAAANHLSDSEISGILNELFPVTKQTTEREKTNIDKIKNEFWTCYFAPDIQRFRGSSWAVINAMSDMVTHTFPHRNTKNYAENNWGRIMAGHALLDKTVKLAGATT